MARSGNYKISSNDIKLLSLQHEIPGLTIMHVIEIENTSEYDILVTSDKNMMNKTLIDGLTRLLVYKLRDRVPQKIVRSFIKNIVESNDLDNRTELEDAICAYQEYLETLNTQSHQSDRSNFGIFLYQHYKEQGVRKTWKEISDIVGVSRQAMNKQRHRSVNRLTKQGERE